MVDYQYEYTIKDHLGNARVSFSDLDKSGKVEQSEVLQTNHYYPFGLVHEGNQVPQQGPENMYQFNGTERIKDFELDWNHTQFRTYDNALGRWHQIDPKNSERESGYVGLGNNPVIYSDLLGDSAWVTSGDIYTDANGIQRQDHVFNMTIAMYDLSDANISPTEIKSKIEAKLKDAIETNNLTINDVKHSITTNISIDIVSSMDEVKDTDHLLVLTDNVWDEAGDSRNGIARLNGQIAYVRTGNFGGKRSSESIAISAVHELGHNLGLEHSWEDGFEDTGGYSSNNYMSYGENRNAFSYTQLKMILSNTGALEDNSGELNFLNQGNSFQYSTKTEDNRLLLYKWSSNKEPWDVNVTRGEKIPKIIGVAN